MTSFDDTDLDQAIDRLMARMVEALSGFVAAPSLSGHEQPATRFLEQTLTDMRLPPERILLDSGLLRGLPLFCCPCDADNGRYNLLARHLPRTPGGRSVLFNGHVDVVPTGPESLWSRPPYEPWVADGWLHGRGAGDMKGGLVCALFALEALRELGLQPAGIVGFNAVLDEENTGNGTLASVHALQNAMAKARLTDFDAVVIPEPFGETLMQAQVGVCWLFVEITGRPAHVAYMSEGVNPIEAAMGVMTALKALEAQWNAPERRHPAFADAAHPINFNLGTIQGGEWNSSVPCTCTMGLRFSFFPGVDADDATAEVTRCIRAAVSRINPALSVEIGIRGHRSPGCVYDLDAPALRALAAAHVETHGTPAQMLASTATTDGRHFALMTDLPVTVYGPLARHIHGIDEAVSLDSMRRVTATFARFIAGWCGVEPLAAGSILGPSAQAPGVPSVADRPLASFEDESDGPAPRTLTRKHAAMTRAPAVPTVQIDNDRVKVTEWRFAPGAETGWHRHGMDYVVVPMTTGSLLLETPQGEVRSPLTAGVSYTRPTGIEHNVVNANDFEFTFVEIELKQR